ncbi:hypothetical protein DFH11DRAFT_1231198 [Phellopilus nigrolimitatus]|nr:hypothetical protein DFH11DRAFT_1231198 [Phellopilus nigrolimitatus]
MFAGESKSTSAAKGLAAGNAQYEIAETADYCRRRARSRWCIFEAGFGCKAVSSAESSRCLQPMDYLFIISYLLQPVAPMKQYRLYDGNPLCANFGDFGEAGPRVQCLWVSRGSFASATSSTWSAGDGTLEKGCSWLRFEASLYNYACWSSSRTVRMTLQVAVGPVSTRGCTEDAVETSALSSRF